jgi:hypothetical protein
MEAPPPPAVRRSAVTGSPDPERPTTVMRTSRVPGSRPLSAGLVTLAALSYISGVGLDMLATRVRVSCSPRADADTTCSGGRIDSVGPALGSVVFHFTAFGMSAGYGYVRGKHGVRRSPRPARLRMRAAAWIGTLLVSAGIASAATSGLATSHDPGKPLTASLIRSVALLGANVGVGLLTWREGTRRIQGGVSIGPESAGGSLRVQF